MILLPPNLMYYGVSRIIIIWPNSWWCSITLGL